MAKASIATGLGLTFQVLIKEVFQKVLVTFLILRHFSYSCRFNVKDLGSSRKGRSVIRGRGGRDFRTGGGNRGYRLYQPHPLPGKVLTEERVPAKPNRCFFSSRFESRVSLYFQTHLPEFSVIGLLLKKQYYGNINFTAGRSPRGTNYAGERQIELRSL